MSFLSVLAAIGHGVHTGVEVVKPLAPLLSAIPGVGGPFATIFQAIQVAEVLIPHDDGSGTQNAAKKALVVAVATANHPGLDPAAAANAVDATIGALKGLQRSADIVTPPASK